MPSWGERDTFLDSGLLPSIARQEYEDSLADRFGHGRLPLSNPVVELVDFRGCLYGLVVLVARFRLEAFVLYYSRSS
jgi:hypothetical protein